MPRLSAASAPGSSYRGRLFSSWPGASYSRGGTPRAVRCGRGINHPPRPPARLARHPGGDPGRGADAVRGEGYAGTSVRAVASAAGVDAALVHHYFGTKDDLFLAALQVPLDPRAGAAARGRGRDRRRGRAAAAHLPLRLGRRGDPAAAAHPGPQRLRPGAASHWSARASCGWSSLPSGAALGVDQRERRMSLVASQLMGIVLARYVVAVEPLASASARSSSWRRTPRRCRATSSARWPESLLPAGRHL